MKGGRDWKKGEVEGMKEEGGGREVEREGGRKLPLVI